MCPLFFIKFLSISKWKPFKKYEKRFLFHLKSSFLSQDIQVFVFSSPPLLLPVSHCFSGWSKKNLKVYDGIDCISKSLITQFVWYLNEIGYDIKILSIIRVSNKEYFHEKSCRKCAPKASPRTLLNFAI